MKKILAIALAVVFMFALAIPAFAAAGAKREETAAWDGNLATGQIGDKIEVIYTVDGNYEITVPAGFTVNADTVSEKVTAKKVLIPAGDVLTVTMESDNELYLVYTENPAADKIKYNVTADGERVENNGVVLTVNVGGVNETGTADDGAAQDEADLVFDFSAKKGAKYQGKYNDLITFTVAITDYVAPGGEG